MATSRRPWPCRPAQDLSLAVFLNRSQHWHAFPGHEQSLPGSSPLPFGNTYRDLIRGLANMPSLALGRDHALRAVSVISAYDPAAADADADATGLIVLVLRVHLESFRSMLEDGSSVSR
ncbi:hypothetical protein BAE44_0025725 [Dichanthelium oligosanthes]|uniref:rRNA N-glycosylase n=1 Tax=Dichanthelium oligosanthes TaxID=888268 RepID=A0A1E5UK45_9POAL|nr:hypothetical protein BAE44_0025725 [Dichanthelium oligosanthes]